MDACWCRLSWLLSRRQEPQSPGLASARASSSTASRRCVASLYCLHVQQRQRLLVLTQQCAGLLADGRHSDVRHPGGRARWTA